jgi:Carboxypeptidase regulatory-like domain
MRTVLLVIGFCVVIFAGAWIIASMIETPETNLPAPQQRVIGTPETAVVVDYEGQIKALQTEIASLKSQITQRTSQEELYRQYALQDYYRSSRVIRDDEYDLEVTVEDDEGDPIENAEVRLTNGVSKTRDTDEDGTVEFLNLDEDCYEVRVERSGYETEEKDICIDDDDDMTFRLSRD